MTENRTASADGKADPFTPQERETITMLNTYLQTINHIDAALLADQPATDLCMGSAALSQAEHSGDVS